MLKINEINGEVDYGTITEALELALLRPITSILFM